MLLAALLLVSPPQEIAITEALVLPSVGRYGRDPVPLDMVQLAIAEGRWRAPKAGDTAAGPDDKPRTWTAAKANAEGWFTGRELNGGYAFASIDSAQKRVMVLEAAGHGMAYVNEEPRAGDVYSYGYVKLPVLLEKGANQLLFHVSRGRLTAKLTEPKGQAFFNTGDMTLPDLVEGDVTPRLGAVVVVNASEQPLTRTTIRCRVENGPVTTENVPTIPPLSVRKVGFRIDRAGLKTKPDTTIEISLHSADKELDRAVLPIRSRGAKQSYKRAFRSLIDNSVQYYAVQPHMGDSNFSPRSIVLSLHGASVEAIGQADAYAPKMWTDIVCPTNRRPYGFDWEDWGRLDALEVLQMARVGGEAYLTGHSMGGHGAWHLGVTHPDIFAAVGPSAGWISFWTYAGGRKYENPDDIEKILQRAASPSDTAALARNLAGLGVYILHGDKDDNVPVTEARAMRDLVNPFVSSFGYHEQPGAGHWWESSDEPGAECVDWPPMFDFFTRMTNPSVAAVREVEFLTANPAVSSHKDWVEIIQQEAPLTISSVRVRVDPHKRRFTGTTSNVHLLALDVRNLLKVDGPIELNLDGQLLKGLPMPPPRSGKSAEPRLVLVRKNGAWSLGSEPKPEEKTPARGRPFKMAFTNRMLFVYGTRGTPEENAWAFNKARFDAESFWYRGNGSIDVVSDLEYGRENTYRNVILYGNADTNGVWPLLLWDSPVQVRRGSVTVGDRKIEGDNLACLFLRPKPIPPTPIRAFSSRPIFQGGIQSGGPMPQPLVGVVSGTGVKGMRVTDRLPYFLAGVHYPDWIVLGSDSLKLGSKGIRAAGFFGNDWKVSLQDGAWR